MTTRSILALAAVLLAAAPVRAQTARRDLAPVRYGLVGGASLASMTETSDTRRVTGAYAGAQIVLPRTEYFSMQIEAAWSQKGVRAAGRDIASGAPIDLTLNNSYVELPILMRLDSPLAIGVEPIGAIPFVLLGPALGVSARCSIYGTSATVRQGVAYDCDDDFGVKTFDFGAMFGAGLDAGIAGGVVSLSVRYTIGLQDVFEATGGRNRALLLLAGVSY